MHYEYKPRGVCAQNIILEVEDGVIQEVTFVGGCDGNAKGLAALCKGADVDEIIKRLEGISCMGKGTSCPGQLAKALKEMTA